jgi:hypothetical protein
MYFNVRLLLFVYVPYSLNESQMWDPHFEIHHEICPKYRHSSIFAVTASRLCQVVDGEKLIFEITVVTYGFCNII